MDQIEHLRDGTKLKTFRGKCVDVISKISFSGGQGDVYRAKCNGREYALKWYNRVATEMTGSDQYKAIKKLADNYPELSKAPGMSNFILPIMMVTESGREITGEPFGYLMELLPENSHELKYLFQGDVKANMPRFSSIHARVWAGLHMMSSIRALHNFGLSYKDLSAGNISANPDTGAVKMVDCDNISDSLQPCSICGTPEYMAPEIIRSGYKITPNINTDQFSEAIVLFKLFYLDHPLEGKRFNDFPLHEGPYAEELYGLHPIYSMAENDTRNRPGCGFAKNVEKRMRIFPGYVKPGFERTFVDGIDTPGARTDENTWINYLTRMRDTLIFISTDPVAEAFVNFDKPKTIPADCLRLSITKGPTRSRIALYDKQSLFKNSFSGNNLEYAQRIGYAYRFNGNRLAIQNQSGATWSVFDPRTRKTTNIVNLGVFEVVPGVQIGFSAAPDIIGIIDDPRTNA